MILRNLVIKHNTLWSETVIHIELMGLIWGGAIISKVWFQVTPIFGSSLKDAKAGELRMIHQIDTNHALCTFPSVWQSLINVWHQRLIKTSQQVLSLADFGETSNKFVHFYTKPENNCNSARKSKVAAESDWSRRGTFQLCGVNTEFAARCCSLEARVGGRSQGANCWPWIQATVFLLLIAHSSFLQNSLEHTFCPTQRRRFANFWQVKCFSGGDR